MTSIPVLSQLSRGKPLTHQVYFLVQLSTWTRVYLIAQRSCFPKDGVVSQRGDQGRRKYWEVGKVDSLSKAKVIGGDAERPIPWAQYLHLLSTQQKHNTNH